VLRRKWWAIEVVGGGIIGSGLASRLGDVSLGRLMAVVLVVAGVKPPTAVQASSDPA